MSTPVPGMPIESRWRPYLAALAFAVPALAVWAFAIRFLYPKVQLVWREGGAVGSEAQWIMDAVGLMVGYAWPVVAVVAVALALVELRPGAWMGYRRVAVGTVVLLLNAAIMVGLAALCVLTLYAAPGLRAG